MTPGAHAKLVQLRDIMQMDEGRRVTLSEAVEAAIEGMYEVRA